MKLTGDGRSPDGSISNFLIRSSSTNSLCRKEACARPKYLGARKTARKDVCLLIRVGQVGQGMLQITAPLIHYDFKIFQFFVNISST